MVSGFFPLPVEWKRLVNTERVWARAVPPRLCVSAVCELWGGHGSEVLSSEDFFFLGPCVR